MSEASSVDSSPSSGDSGAGEDGAHTVAVPSQSSRARWGLIAAGVIQLCTMASTVVPAHFLKPREFALVGAAAVVAGLFSILSEAGYGDTIIASKHADDVKISTTFWFGTGVATAIAAVVAVTSPWTARLIGTPGAAPYIAASAVLLPAGIANAVLQAVHFRRFNHRIAFIGQIAQAVVAAVIPIALVVGGVGAWSLIIGRVAGSLAMIGVLLLVGRVAPRLVFDKKMVKEDLGFNGGSLGTGMLAYAAKNLDYWVLGHFVGATAFGGYYVAFVLPQVVRQRGTWLSQQLLFPVLARIRDDRDAFRRTYLDGLQMVSAVVMPALIGVSVIADLVVRIAFGTSWGSAVTPLRILSAGAAVDVISAVSVTVFLSRKEMSALVIQQIARLIALAVGLIAVPIFRDTRAAAFAVLLSALVGGAASMWALRRRSVAGVGQQLAALVPVVVPTGVMAAAVLVVRPWLADGLAPIVELMVLVSLGVAVYAVAGLTLFRSVFRSFIRRGASVAGVGGLRRKVAGDRS